MGRLLGGEKESHSQSPAMETMLAKLSPLSAADANATHRSDHHHDNEVLNRWGVPYLSLLNNSILRSAFIAVPCN